MNFETLFHYTGPTEGRVFSAVGDVYTLLIAGEQTGDAYALLEAVVPPGGGPPPHVHSREDEAFYVLEGEITFQVEGRSLTVGAGGFIHLRRGSEHAFKNAGRVPGRMLILVTPAGFERFLAEFAHPLASKTAPPPPVTPEDVERLLAVAPRYGIEVRLPPA